MVTYKIIRKYFDGHEEEVIKEGLSLEEARDHCADDNASSQTCYTLDAIDLTRTKGRWFDCYYKE